MAIHIIVPPESRERAEELRGRLLAGSTIPGARLSEKLGTGPPPGDTPDFLLRLIATKMPRIFAESEISGDGSDWTQEELRLLGDVSVAVDTTIFDDGRHHSPRVHERRFGGMLVFTPGALLRGNGISPPCDLAEVTDSAGNLDEDAFTGLYLRRLSPVFDFIHHRALAFGQRALVTMPGLGCGQFAGRFAGRLGAMLGRALHHILLVNAAKWPGLGAVYYDPYSEGKNERHRIGETDFLIRPLCHGNEDKPQLCPPESYAEAGDDFSGFLFHGIVAWDHVSWPGNDFWGGARATDDGVKAAATDVMKSLTGVEGSYDPATHTYKPPGPWRTWEEVASAHHPEWWRTNLNP
ncbi:MAG: hypothetical protein ACKO2G_03495 [Verrucomicrobiales bacterium]